MRRFKGFEVALIKLLGKLKKFVIYLIGDFIYLLSYLVPKNERLWVFGAWFGQKYCDNSRALFEYVNEKCLQIRAVWLTENKTTLDLVRGKGYEAYYTYSLAGFLISIKAKYGVISQSLKDINIFTHGRMNIIQLWHGIPLKKIVYDDNISRSKSKILSILKYIFPFIKDSYTKFMLISTSEEVSRKIASAFRVDLNNVKITGYPRNDIFFTGNKRMSPLGRKLLELKRIFSAIGIYMPTHRKEGNKDLFTIFPDLEWLNAKLKEQNVLLFIKMHFYHLTLVGQKNVELSNVIFICDEDIEQDIYHLLPHTDFLITDYSSVYFDYLLLNKPIIFAPFDIEDYTKTDRELYYNYDEVTPGPKASNWEQVLAYIKEIVIEGHDNYKEQREQITKVFHEYKDGRSSERVFKEILSYFG